MNKSSPEYIRVRTEIAINLWANDDEVTFKEAERMWNLCTEDAIKGHRGDSTKEPNSCAVCTINNFLNRADSILSIKGIAIEADNQTEPEALPDPHPEWNHGLRFCTWNDCWEAISLANFKKVV